MGDKVPITNSAPSPSPRVNYSLTATNNSSFLGKKFRALKATRLPRQSRGSRKRIGITGRKPIVSKLVKVYCTTFINGEVRVNAFNGELEKMHLLLTTFEDELNEY
ncbi:hypothetical protein NPIL_269691 [Nephila pilipes]|uniref:Uncharacterized protein n=1 Tax=Nephila pilipes TaxID=299642 RepID=A0A8X6UA20_NEPPI|nr:hypothetical protein NPIL_269691 [Nephila pilipes]